MARRTNKNRAFILVLILAVLVIATTVLAGWAYRISSGSLISGEIASDIQRKWGVLSCRRAFLNSADTLWGDGNEEAAEADEVAENEVTSEDEEIVTQISREIVLSDITYKVTLADEQAKAKINLLMSSDTVQTTANISALIPDTEAVSLKIDETKTETLYNSYDEILDYGNSPEILFENISNITCWGDGLVNCKRATKETLAVVTTGILSETDIENLISFRQESPDATLAELLSKLGLKKKQIDKLKEILTDQSNCKSLQVISNDDSRSRYYLFVEESQSTGEEDAKKVWCYKW